MMPDEQLLVKRLKDQPFALLGVNMDADKALPQDLVDKKEVTWRNWWDGNHRIARRWHIQYLPATFILDPQGMIRFQDVGAIDGEVLNKTVDDLLAERNGPNKLAVIAR